MKEIQAFNFEQNEVRTLQVNNQHYFVLADVCKVLDLKNPTMVARKLDDDERAKSDLGLQERNVTLINESGLYAVILRSDKPQAKQFRKWITAEVLPTLRKTGMYTVKQTDKVKAQLAEARQRNARAREASVYLKLADRVTIETYRQILISKSAEVLAGQMILPLPSAPVMSYSAKDIGDMLGISGNMVGRLANRYGLKTPEYGELVWDKSQSSAHQCQTFRYYISVVPVLQRLIVEVA